MEIGPKARRLPDFLPEPSLTNNFYLAYFILAYCDVTPYLRCYSAAWKECQRYGEKWSKKWAHEPTLIKITAEIPAILAQHGSPVSKDGYTTWEMFLEVFLQRGMIVRLCFHLVMRVGMKSSL